MENQIIIDLRILFSPGHSLWFDTIRIQGVPRLKITFRLMLYSLESAMATNLTKDSIFLPLILISKWRKGLFVLLMDKLNSWIFYPVLMQNQKSSS